MKVKVVDNEKINNFSVGPFYFSRFLIIGMSFLGLIFFVITSTLIEKKTPLQMENRQKIEKNRKISPRLRKNPFFADVH